MNSVALHSQDGARVARGIVASECTNARTGAECSNSAVLLTSELVTNALRHGRGSVSLRVNADTLHVRVEVYDAEPRPPIVVVAGPDAESGRGVLILDSLAAAWGVEDKPDGKIVWFELPAQP
ncbi:MAG: ATP-binding protein [Mycobacteriales bacterium]